MHRNKTGISWTPKYNYQSADALGVLTEMQKNLATVQRPPLILLGLLLGPTGPGPDMLVYPSAVFGHGLR